MIPTAFAAIVGIGDVNPFDPSMWTSSTTGYIGKISTGTVTIDGENEMLSDYCYLGDNSGSIGTVTVTGKNAKWTNGKYLYVGNSGSGTLNIEDGGQVFSKNIGYLGNNPGSAGTATIKGTGSIWTNTMYLYVGDCGTGTLTIEEGGQASNYCGFIGRLEPSTSSATITGTGSKWTNDFLYVGYLGNGKLTVAEGGMVITKHGLFASLDNLYGNGIITTNGGVLDTDLIFDASHGLNKTFSFGVGGTLYFNEDGNGDLGAGYKGSATLKIAEGVIVPSTRGYIGYQAGSNGMAMITGSGSRWDNSSHLYIGNYGTGTLNIEDGGQLNCNKCFIADKTGSIGTATITGMNSLWTANNFIVSGFGIGTLNIGNGGDSGGMITAKNIDIAYYSNSTGICNIDGGMLNAGKISKGLGNACFNWQDGIIHNYDSGTNLIIANNLVLQLAYSGTHTFNIDSGRDGTVDAVLSDATTGGTLNKVGGGTLLLTAANTYSGATTIEEGRFKVTGSILKTNGITVKEAGILELAKTSGNATAATLNIDNAGTILVSTGSQNVGAISGTGITQVIGSAKLTAQSIIQNSLTIGGTGAGFADMAEASSMSEVPEPSTVILFAMGCVGLVAYTWLRQKE
jgi:T5SS/PEP-CTERM-associated repeat protein/autotransporter-associated beta strand protein